ncbi:MAG: phage tail sheath subtilisin-like domain-containing protein [Reinekea sp.]
MPEYLAPGVFVEEVSFRAKSIEGVSTSVAGMAGPTAFGPVRGTPEVLTSYGEFERVFGAPSKLSFDGQSYLNHTALAARAFFENGGKQLYLSRVISGGNETDASGNGGSAATAGASGATISFAARFPGSGGNLDLEFVWQDQQNLLKTRNMASFDAIPDGTSGFLTIAATVTQDEIINPVGAFSFSSLKVLATKNGANLDFIGTGAIADTNTAVPLANLGDGISGADLDALGFNFKQLYADQPDSSALSADTPAQVLLSAAIDIEPYTGIDLSSLSITSIMRGGLNAAGTELAITGPNTVPLAALAAESGSVKAITVQRDFAIDVIRRKKGGAPGEGEPIYQTGILSLDNTKPNYIGSLLIQDPEKVQDKLTLPMACSVTGTPTAGALHTALLAMFSDDASSGKISALNPPATSFEEPRFLVVLAGGNDGSMPAAIDYHGETDDKGSTGLASLEEVEDVSIVLTPAAVISAANHQAIVTEVEKHCMKMRYRIGIVDSREDMAISELRTFRNNFDNSRLALYSPWVVTSDPTGESLTISVPPSGYMAGIYARTDVNRGVHKAPANTVVQGALRFHQNINKFQQEILNPQGINCLRSFAGRGHRVWGGRTLSSDPEWKYVNVRRYFLYLEKSIEKGTQWAVFEPNGDALWANVAATVDSFLFNEWKNGRLLGSKPSSAYFVRCDRTTMTQNDIDNGRLVCEVGVAPLRPAEFVIFRVGQKTADA